MSEDNRPDSCMYRQHKNGEPWPQGECPACGKIKDANGVCVEALEVKSGEPVAYHFPGNDREGRQLGYPDELDEGQKANCLPLYLGAGDAIAAKDREIAETRQRTIEECAKVADAERSGVDYPGEVWIANRIAAAIRSLGKEGSGE